MSLGVGQTEFLSGGSGGAWVSKLIQAVTEVRSSWLWDRSSHFLAGCQPRAALHIQRLHGFLAMWVPLSPTPAMENLSHLESLSEFVSLSSLDLDLPNLSSTDLGP